MKRLAYIFTLTCLTILSACSSSDDKGGGGGGGGGGGKQYSVTITSGEMSTVASEGGTATISFTCNDKWTASCAGSWCTLSASEGASGSNSITVEVQPNDSYDERNTSVTITCGKASKNATITQKQKNAILISSSKLEVDYNGGDAEITVQSNISYTYEITSGSEWIKEGTSTKGLKSSTIYLEIDENWEQEVRQGEIVVKGGDISDTVKVYQQASTPRIVISDPEIEVGSGAQDIKVELKSNCNYTIQMPSVDWITQKVTKAPSVYTLEFTVAENTTYDNRYAEISITNEDTQEIETISVSQSQKNAIVIAKKEYEVDPTGATISFNVNTNVEFETAIDVDWIVKAEPTKGLEDVPVSFTVSPYTGYDNRVGHITFSYGDIEQVVTITQKQNNALILTKKQLDITSDAQKVTVKLKTNCEYDVTMPQVDWISEDQTKGLVEYSHVYNISENTAYDSRSAIIIYTIKGTEISDTVTINQSQKNAIILGKNEYECADIGETLNFKVSTNVKFNTEIDVNWITETEPTKGLQDVDVAFKVSANKGDEIRTGHITFTYGDIEQVVTVTQKFGNKIIIEKEKYDVTSAAQQITVKIQSNCEYEISMPKVDWITEEKTKGMEEHTHVFNISENTSYDSRSATIEFTIEGVTAQDNVVINQAQKDAIVIGTESYEVGYKANTIEIKVNTNVEFQSKADVDWITKVPDAKGLVEKTVSYSIATNNTAEERVGHITFSYGSIEQTVTVTQAENSNISIGKIKHSEKTFTIPEIGNILSGTIDWGDGKNEPYSKGATHEYADESEKTVTIQWVGGTYVKINKLQSISEIEGQYTVEE